MIPRVDKAEEATKAWIDRVAVVVNSIAACPLLDGRLLKGVALSGSATRVDHGLNRIPIGFLVIGANNSAPVWESTARTALSLFLKAGATATVDLWVF